MKPIPTILSIVFISAAISCSSSKGPANRVNAASTSTSHSSSQNSTSAPAPGESNPSNPLVGTWTGQVMIDKLPAKLSLTFRDDGKLVFDLGATERSRPDYKIEEYLIDDSSHLRTVYTEEDEPRDEQKFEYKLEGDTLTLKEFDLVIVLTGKKN